MAPADLITGVTYKFKVDLSPYPYASLRKNLPLASIPADNSIQRMVTEERKEVAFLVRPIIAEGSGLRVVGKLNALKLPVNLGRLREPAQQHAVEFATGDITLPQFSNRDGAGFLSIEVEALTPGCASIVLAIFTGDGRMPLDHLVRRVAITTPGEPIYTCGATEQSDQEETPGA